MIFVTKSKKGGISMFALIIMMLVSGISGVLYVVAYDNLYMEKNFFYSASSYYAAETGIERGLYQFKINPDDDSFVGENSIINETNNKKQIEYRDQYFYRLEKVIEEFIPAGKNIQLFFDNKLNPNITKFHIAYLKRDNNVKPTSEQDCLTPKYDASVEVGVFSTINEYSGGAYTTVLANNVNKCESGYGVASKISINTINNPYSTLKMTVAGGRCLLNNKGNISGGATSTWENRFSYTFDNMGTDDVSDNRCILNYGSGSTSNDKYFTTDEEVKKRVDGYQHWTTIIDGLDVRSRITKDADKIIIEIRAVDDDANVLIWATDDNGVAYDIPGRFINFTATGKASAKAGLENDVYRRMVVKRKINKDLLPIFDFTLFSESEFIK